jgi:hypothetical protein
MRHCTLGAGKWLYVVFIDRNKAFDSVSRKFIFEKLISFNKLSAPCMKLIADILDINFLTIDPIDDMAFIHLKRLCNQMGYARDLPLLLTLMC